MSCRQTDKHTERGENITSFTLGGAGKKVQKLINFTTDLSAYFQLSTKSGNPSWQVNLGCGTTTHQTMNRGSQCQTWHQGQLSGHITCFWYSLACSLTLQTLYLWHPRSTPEVATLLHFLNSHNQHVALNRILSSPLHVKSEVPQGSDLGPVLFLNFINDLSDALENPL